MNKNTYTKEIVTRYKHLLFSDSTIINNPNALAYRSGGCSTRLKLLKTDSILKHCTSADMHGVVTSDCICEFINNNVDNKSLITEYLIKIASNQQTDTSIDSIINLSEIPRSVYLITSYYRTYINE